MTSLDIGLIGLGVMGRNLALNLASRGVSVAVLNHTAETTRAFVSGEARGTKITPFFDLGELVSSLARPRRVILLVKAGAPVDEVLEALTPHLEGNDIVVDGGNSDYRDTERRFAAWSARGIRFVGMGVSGGEEGARRGPSLMPGGDRTAYGELEGVLRRIAAETASGPCVAYVGKRSAGHFVKMVHNGIEYGDMELIAESYDLLRRAVGLSNHEAADVFRAWNKGPLASFLIEITGEVLDFQDEEADGHALVDRIQDTAGSKGTGRWTIEAALELGVPVPTIAAALDQRLISRLKPDRVRAAALYGAAGRAPKARAQRAIVDKAARALYASKICCYAQGFALLAAANSRLDYGLDLSEIARIWKGGCIIRAELLDRIRGAFGRRPDLPNLLLDAEFAAETTAAYDDWRETIVCAQVLGIPVPAMSASFAYFGSLTTERLPANLIQAQRDYFGAHTYERTDREGTFHTEWKKK